MASTAQGERAGRHVFSDRRAGTNGDVFAQGQWCYKHGICPGFAAGAHHGAVLAHAVVIGGDCACSHVNASAQICVADIAEMVYFHAIGKTAVFHFHKIADVTVLCQ